MGASQSKHQKRAITINHEKFTKVQSIISTDTIMLQIPIKNEEDYHEWEKKIQKLQGFDSQMYLFPLSLKFDPRTLCGESGALSIQYDNYPFILLDEITNRKQIFKHFDESEMWYLLFCLVTASHFFNNLNSKVGDIQPKNVFINQMGQLKVSTVFSWPCEEDNLSKTQKFGIITYLAPQQMQMLRTKKMDILLNYQISQCFSIGMTMLHAGLLHDMKDLYKPQTFTFDKRKFHQYLEEWKQLSFKVDKGSPISYSVPLKEAVLGLCEYNPHQRVSSSFLYSWMEKYIDNIVNLKSFTIGTPPVKNHLKNQSPEYVHFNRQPINTAKAPRSLSHFNYIDNYTPQNNLIYPHQQFNKPSNTNNQTILSGNNSYPRNYSNQKINMNYNNQIGNSAFLPSSVLVNNPKEFSQRPTSIYRQTDRTGGTSPARNKMINFEYDQPRRSNKLY